jgi:hypothetical protein
MKRGARPNASGRRKGAHLSEHAPMVRVGRNTEQQ